MIQPEPIACRPTRTDRALVYGSSRDEQQRSNPRVERQYRRLTNAILREFPPASGGAILLSGVGSGEHVAEVAWRVSTCLASLHNVPVILVDGDFSSRSLTMRTAADGKPGLAEVLAQQLPLSTALTATEIASHQFLAFGDQRLARNPIAASRVAETLSELRRFGRFVIVGAGASSNSLHAILSRHCDATYLVVQLGVADRHETSDLSDYLTRAGGRLMGCIATGVS